MVTMTVLDSLGVSQTVEKPLAPSRSAAATSRPVAVSTEDKAVLDAIAASLVTIDGRVDGLEALIASTNTKLDTAIIALQIIDNLTYGAGAVDAGTQRFAMASDSAGIIATGTQGSPSAQYISSVNAGDIVHDGADSGNPVKTGGRARSSEIAAVANNDRSDFITDLVGKQIVLPYANPENFVSGAITSAMTGTTSTSLIAAPASGLRNYITQITVSNSHATVGTDVIIQDGFGGTTLYTIPAAAVYGGAVITFPTPLRQPTTATAIFCANVTTGASTKVSASGYKGV